MKVVNVHQRLLHASADQVGELLATLGTPEDRLWPGNGWPRMRLDRPLAVGAQGGHGPIRYRVEAWEPGRSVRFRFTQQGVDGWHAFEVLDGTAQHCVLEHRLEARFTGKALLGWALAIRWLHDACVEDLLSRAQAAVGHTPRPVRWSQWVRLLMAVLSRLPRRTKRGAHAGA